jgi:hypothetical protein
MLPTLTHESFEPHIGTDFAISAAGQEEALTLVDVTYGKQFPGYDRMPFTLVFKGSREDGHFLSEMFELVHPEMGTLAIMISPTGRFEDGRYRYEAIFG